MRTVLAIFFLLLAAADEPHRVSQSGHRAFAPSLTPTSDGFVVAWQDTRDGHPEIYARMLDKRGQPAGPERRLTKGNDATYDADVAAIGNDVAVAWYEVGSNQTPRAMLGMWARDGQRIWAKPLALPERISRNPVIRARRQELFCAWLAENAARDFEVYAAWFDHKGNPLTPALRVGPAGPTTHSVNATLDVNGDAWVVYDARVNTRASEVFVARVTKTASHIARVTADDGRASSSPDIAVGADRVALTWFDERAGSQDIYLFIARADDLNEGLESRAIKVNSAPGASTGASVAWNARRRRFGLSWCDTQARHEVHVQEFDPNGSPAEAERMPRNAADSLIPALEPAQSSEGFAVAWTDDAEVSFALIR